MEIVVHRPEEEEGRRELARRVAIVHAQTIAEKLAALSCPVEQEAALYEEIEERYQAGSDPTLPLAAARHSPVMQPEPLKIS